MNNRYNLETIQQTFEVKDKQQETWFVEDNKCFLINWLPQSSNFIRTSPYFFVLNQIIPPNTLFHEKSRFCKYEVDTHYLSYMLYFPLKEN